MVGEPGPQREDGTDCLMPVLNQRPGKEKQAGPVSPLSCACQRQEDVWVGVGCHHVFLPPSSTLVLQKIGWKATHTSPAFLFSLKTNTFEVQR